MHAGRKEGWRDDDGVCVCVCVEEALLGVVWRCAWGKGEREGKVGRFEMGWEHVDMCH